MTSSARRRCLAAVTGLVAAAALTLTGATSGATAAPSNDRDLRFQENGPATLRSDT
jgi:hypothetical protein